MRLTPRAGVMLGLCGVLLARCAAESATPPSPQADAGPDLVVAVGAPAVLDGASHLTDRPSYEWRLVAGPAGATLAGGGPQARFVAAAAGQHVIALVVLDGDRRSSPDYAVVTAQSCPDLDLDGDALPPCGADCDDADAARHREATEVCGDGVDQDCDGTPDDGCACAEGAVVDCYGGPRGTRDVGACRAGAQRCTAGVLGTCEGEVRPAADVCDASGDLDCDGRLGCAEEACAGSVGCTELCAVVGDEDGDGLADCAAPICDGRPCGPAGASCVTGRCACPGGEGPEARCADGVDDDCDGALDCLDPDCVAAAACAGVERCDNGVDDDGDGEIDCGDATCDGASCGAGGRRCAGFLCGCPAAGAERCDDGLDQGCDGLLDCADASCDGASCGGTGRRCAAGSCACATPGAESCADGLDQGCDGLLDCADGGCDGQLCGAMGRRCSGGGCACPTAGAELCGDGLDQGCDGVIDCADSACDGAACGAAGQRCAAGTCACVAAGAESRCGDGLDDDCDGQTDCADADCAGQITCCADVDLGSRLSTPAAPILAAGDTTNEPDDFDPICPNENGVNRAGDRTFAFTAPAAGDYIIALYGLNFDPVLTVRDGCPGAEVVCLDDSPSGDQDPASRVSGFAAGETVLIVVDGFENEEGPFELLIHPAPAGSEASCLDGLDDDGDGFVDCADPSCNADPCDGGGRDCTDRVCGGR